MEERRPDSFIGNSFMDGNAAWKGGRARCRAERGTGIGSGDEEGRRITRRLADRESGDESRPARLRSAFHERNAPATAARPCGTPAVPAATHVAAPRRNRTSRAAPSARFRGRASSKIPLWFETSPFRGKNGPDKTARPMKSFLGPPREGQSARSPSVGRGVIRRMGRLWIETCPILLQARPGNNPECSRRAAGCSARREWPARWRARRTW